MQKRRKELLRGWFVLFLSGIHRLHIAHRRRADAGANEKEVVRSTAVFASAKRGHRAPRDTTGIRPYPAMSDRNNINEIRKRSNISYFSNLTHL